jgi:L-ribulose-5-phosphate 3-epimerase
MTQNAPLSHFVVNTYSYTLDLPVRETMQRLASAGCSEFELMMYPGHLWPELIDKQARRALKDFMSSNGLSVSTLNMPNIDVNIAAANPGMRELSLGILRDTLELAGDLGAEGVVIGPGKANPLMPMPRAQLMDHFLRALTQLVPLAADHGTAVYVENMPFAFLPGMGELLDALAQYGDDSVGVVYDVANGHFVREDIEAALRACAPRLRVLHLSDTHQTLYRHDEIGLGSVDFASLPKVLAEIGFRRKPTLEIIAADRDTAIGRSAQRLLGSGWTGLADTGP